MARRILKIGAVIQDIGGHSIISGSDLYEFPEDFNHKSLAGNSINIEAHDTIFSTNIVSISYSLSNRRIIYLEIPQDIVHNVKEGNVVLLDE